MKKSMLKRMLKCWPIALALLLLSLTALADAALPAELTVIRAEAFRGDTSLTGALTLPEGLTVIGARAFEGCTGLTGQLVLPSTVTTIGSRAFADCTGLTGTVRIPASVTSLAEDAFDGTALIIVTGGSPDTDLPGGETIVTMTDLPEGIAYEMTGEGAVITGYTGAVDATLKLPASINGIPVVAIDDYAFQDCYGLTGSVVIPSTVRRIGTGAFFGCSSLDGTLTIPSSVTSIGDFAFYECLSLTGGLTIPASVETVGESAFAFCESMSGPLSLPSGVTLGARCFQSAGFTGSIAIPATMTLGPNVFVGTRLNISWAAPGFTYEQTGTVITITGWNGPVAGGLTIPAQLGGGIVSGIAGEAFADVGLQGTVTIPGSVTYIGPSAFRSNPGVTSVTFHSGLKTVSAYAFADCTGLTSTITLPATVSTLDETAFSGCSVTVERAQ
ncbi:MAG: leucine-rich repeat domain-containing protein [Clostridia bacterium]|nr:leucine-rich repeat domain-containing protein [Clostridia bacterium]